MAWYTSSDNQINRPRLSPAWTSSIVHGQDAAAETIAGTLANDAARLQRPVFIALETFKGVSLDSFILALTSQLQSRHCQVECVNVNSIFLSQEEIQKRIEPFTLPDDPSFGRVFPGTIADFIDPALLRNQLDAWETECLRGSEVPRIIICHGMGAATALWAHRFDRVAYFDLTREEIIRRAERNEVTPLGSDEAEGFPWRRIYYVEYPALNKQKKHVLSQLDWYVDATEVGNPKLVPASVYHAMMIELSGMPICFKVFYMPGTFGGTEFGRRFKVDGLPNTSWDYEISIGDNHLQVDPGDGRILEIPFYNLIFEQPLRFLGSYSHATYPDHFPIAIYMQDGTASPGDNPGFKRTHMPNHLHPDSAYCREHFNEPIGRYETYYIVRADSDAVTMHGFKDNADIDAYIEEVKQSATTGKEFDWRKYIYEHPSSTGELHQLPPGTVHGTGGRQIILEIDTNPSRESTEYSFYLYDYCRPNFNYEENNFEGRPAKLQVEHSLAIMRRNRRQAFMAKHCRPAPECIRQGEGWREMSFPMYYNMPYQVNRFEFSDKIVDDTQDQFHCLALTQGQRVRVASLRDPENAFILEDCDNIVLPACFGPYVCENLGEGPCQIIKTLLITEARDHIDQAREEADMGRD